MELLKTFKQREDTLYFMSMKVNHNSANNILLTSFFLLSFCSLGWIQWELSVCPFAVLSIRNLFPFIPLLHDNSNFIFFLNCVVLYAFSNKSNGNDLYFYYFYRIIIYCQLLIVMVPNDHFWHLYCQRFHIMERFLIRCEIFISSFIFYIDTIILFKG